ncbi:hypothetical protein QNM99_19175 [Pseudomonas sp. PCH446]
MSLDRDLEELARELFELSTKGSKLLWDELKTRNIKEDVDLRSRFFASSHGGMRKAQKTIIEIMQTNEIFTDSKTILLRGLPIVWHGR